MFVLPHQPDGCEQPVSAGSATEYSGGSPLFRGLSIVIMSVADGLKQIDRVEDRTAPEFLYLIVGLRDKLI
jgi:hypothetical protein